MMHGRWLLVSDSGEIVRFWTHGGQQQALRVLNRDGYRWAQHYSTAPRTVTMSIFMLPIYTAAFVLLAFDALQGVDPLWLAVPLLLLCYVNGIRHALRLRSVAAGIDGKADDAVS